MYAGVGKVDAMYILSKLLAKGSQTNLNLLVNECCIFCATAITPGNFDGIGFMNDSCLKSMLDLHC